MRSGEELLGLAEDAVRIAMTKGADHAEAFLREGRSISLDAKGTRVTPTESHAVGIGVRVMVQGQMGIAGTAGLHRTAETVDEAIRVARATGNTLHKYDEERSVDDEGFVAPRPIGVAPSPIHPDIASPDMDRLLTTVTSTMWALQTPETSFSAVTLRSGRSRFAVANDAGVAAWDQAGRESIHIENRVDRGGRQVTAWDDATGLEPIDSVVGATERASDVAVRATAALDPTPLERPVDGVILDQAVTAQFFVPFLSNFSGARLAAGHSRFKDSEDEPVASSALTLYDHPAGPRGQRLRVDHEGSPTQDKTLIDHGRLHGMLHDLTSARACRAERTGNGVRSKGWTGNVGPAPIHPIMAPGSKSLDDLIADADRAVLLRDPLTGMFTANSVTGEFSATAPYAFLVEEGSITGALPNLTVAGNVHDLVNQIHGVGKDLRETRPGTFAALSAGGVICAT